MNHDDLAILISSSPIESHPSTAILDETIASVRYHFPNSFIKVMCDGVRPEQEDKRAAYEEYLKRITFTQRGLIGFCVYKFVHQARLTQLCLEQIVPQPLILFLEHDCPLLPREIDWEMLKHQVLNGHTNHVRLHYDETIHPEHTHLMHGKLTNNLIKTTQFHCRPFLTRTHWFYDLLCRSFTKDSRSFIEDRVYTFVDQAPWENYRCTIYDPEGTGQNMKRSGHTNGRGSEQKYSMTF
jgi:hypothetical protein